MRNSVGDILLSHEIMRTRVNYIDIKTIRLPKFSDSDHRYETQLHSDTGQSLVIATYYTRPDAITGHAWIANSILFFDNPSRAVGKLL